MRDIVCSLVCSLLFSYPMQWKKDEVRAPANLSLCLSVYVCMFVWLSVVRGWGETKRRRKTESLLPKRMVVVVVMVVIACVRLKDTNELIDSCCLIYSCEWIYNTSSLPFLHGWMDEIKEICTELYSTPTSVRPSILYTQGRTEKSGTQERHEWMKEGVNEIISKGWATEAVCCMVHNTTQQNT